MSVDNQSIISQIEAMTDESSAKRALVLETQPEIRTCPQPTSKFRSVIHDEEYNKELNDKRELVPNSSIKYVFMSQRVDWTNYDFRLHDLDLDETINLLAGLENGSSNQLTFKNNMFFKSVEPLVEFCFENVAKCKAKNIFIMDNQFHRIPSGILKAMSRPLISSQVEYLCLQRNDLGRMTQARIRAFFGNIAESSIVHIDIRNNGLQKTKLECLNLFMDILSKSSITNVEYTDSEFSQTSVDLMKEIIRHNQIKTNARRISSLENGTLSSQHSGFSNGITNHSTTNPMLFNHSTTISHRISTNGTQSTQNKGINQASVTNLSTIKRNREILNQYQMTLSNNSLNRDPDHLKEEKRNDGSLPSKKIRVQGPSRND